MSLTLEKEPATKAGDLQEDKRTSTSKKLGTSSASSLRAAAGERLEDCRRVEAVRRGRLVDDMKVGLGWVSTY